MPEFIDSQIPQLHLRNVVATIDLGVAAPIRLSEIFPVLSAKSAAGSYEVKYDPARFIAMSVRLGRDGQCPAAIFHRHPTERKILIFSSGRVVCTGARTISEGWHAARLLAKIIGEANVELFSQQQADLCFKVRNLVGSATLPFRLDLNKIATAHKEAFYEPEIFSGLHFRPIPTGADQPRNLVIIAFSSGKIILTGACEWGQIKESYVYIYSIFKGCAK